MRRTISALRGLIECLYKLYFSLSGLPQYAQARSAEHPKYSWAMGVILCLLYKVKYVVRGASGVKQGFEAAAKYAVSKMYHKELV